MQKNWRILGMSLLLLFATLLMTTAATEAAPPKKSPVKPPASQGSREKKPSPNVNKSDVKVKQLQQLLADTGFYPGQMTGVLDSTTKDAIIRGQKAYKLAQTGKYDQKLVELLTREARNKPSKYRKKMTMQATAYTSQDPGSGNLTKREHRLRKGLVAVDPRVIPLGTRLYVEGYGYAVADDIGSAIKGAKIDLAYENRKEALKFGRRMLTVFVLD